MRGRKGSVRGSYRITGHNVPHGPGRAEMTSIIWYIYNEYLKKERELAEKAQEKVRKQVDRLRNGDNAGTGDGQKKG